MRSVVVLPAPFGPTMPKNEPGATSRSTWSTATLGPNVLRRPRAVSAAWPLTRSVRRHGASVRDVKR